MHDSGTAHDNSKRVEQRERTGTHPMWLGIGLLLMAAVLGLGLAAARPPAPKPATAPPPEFSASRAWLVLERLLGDGAPHPVGSAANALVRDRVVSELTDLGYTVETQETLGCRVAWATCGQVANILTRLPGRVDGPAVLLTAHYDSVAAGPGAADDMAGVAAIIEIARILRHEAPLPHPVILLLSDGEEPGLLGAEAFAAEHRWAAEVGVVVNLEASGTSGPSTLIETTADNAWLIDAYRRQAPRPAASSLFDELIAYTTQHTDLTVYEANGIPGVNFAFMEDHAAYHTPLDNLANLDPGSVQHQGDNALAAVRAFAGIDLANPPAGSDVYVDLLPGLVVQWPVPLTVGGAAACLALLGSVAVRLIRGGELRGRALLRGLLVLPVGIVAAGTFGFGWATAVSGLTGPPVPWYAQPGPMRVAVWTGALLCVGLAGVLLARRTAFWGLSLGVWLGWAALTGLVGWLAPGAGVMFLPPAMLGAVALAVAGLSPLRAKPWPRHVAVLAGTAGAGWFWLSFAIGVEQTDGGAELAAMIAAAAALAASPLAALVAWPLPYQRWRRWSFGAAALLVAAATGAAVLVPVSSAERPRPLNLIHFEERHRNESRWLLHDNLAPDISAAAMPAGLLDAGPFADEAAAVMPWSNRRYLVAPAPVAAAPAPEVVVVSDEQRAGGRAVELELRSPRGGDKISLYVPAAAGLQRIVVAGTPHVVEAPPSRFGYQAFHCHTAACDGLKLELHLASTAAVELIIVDSTPGLPASGGELLAARSSTAVPSGDGDVSLVVDRVVLPAS